MRWEKTKVFKIVISFVVAFGASCLVSQKILIPGTMVVNPAVKGIFFSLPRKVVQLPSRFLDLMNWRFISDFSTPRPVVPGQYFPTRQPVFAPPSQPTQSPGGSSPAPGVTPPPNIPPPTLVPTPTPAPTSVPTPIPTPIPTPTPSGVTVDAFAQCLTNRGMKMYGVNGCGFCQQQKNMFGAAFTYIDYIDCIQQGQVCDQKGITGYPTWEDGSDNFYLGVQSFSSLGRISDCLAPN